MVNGSVGTLGNAPGEAYDLRGPRGQGSTLTASVWTSEVGAMGGGPRRQGHDLSCPY